MDRCRVSQIMVSKISMPIRLHTRLKLSLTRPGEMPGNILPLLFLAARQKHDNHDHSMEVLMEIQHVPIAKTEMLIRKPISEVFEAFVDPAITSKFWFTKGSGRLETGKQIRWEWEMYNHSVEVSVKAIEENKRILIEWGAYREATTVEWVFTSRPDNTTVVSVANSGFTGDGDEVVKQALDSTGGFNLVLAAAKAFLEHNINLNLISDRFPDQFEKH